MMLLRKKAFTLLELIIVVIIIGVLSSLALPRLMSVIERSRAAEAYAAISSIRMALERYYLMNGSFDGVNLAALGIEDPGLSPNTHFTYSVSAYRGRLPGPAMGYTINAVRNTRDISDIDAYHDGGFVGVIADVPCGRMGLRPKICVYGGYGGIYFIKKNAPYK